MKFSIRGDRRGHILMIRKQQSNVAMRSAILEIVMLLLTVIPYHMRRTQVLLWNKRIKAISSRKVLEKIQESTGTKRVINKALLIKTKCALLGLL